MSPVLPHITLQTGKDPSYSIIWLHGLGANGSDFVPIVDEIELPHAVRYIFPHAPKRPVTINGGFIMPAWYDIRSDIISEAQDAAGIRESQLAVEALIAQEIAAGIVPSHIFLAGFSQGGAIALHCGLRSSERLGGVLALSTYLPLADTVQDEAHPATSSTPIFMAHGRSDPVVPYALGKASQEKLSALGYGVEWREYAMPHTVCMEEVEAITLWLKAKM
ncbi:MAG: phospholipase/carboxylesterase [Gallionellaceae bacterium]|nr:MAG: phospholipase/carboxylesterase [Gallionellaceae bacterium]